MLFCGERSYVDCLFFFLMIRRPPRSTRTDTLFPYTTLFRSVVVFAQRHAPKRLVDRLAGGDQPVGQGVVIAEQPGAELAERDDDGSGQRRQIDHEPGLEAVLGVPQRVGEQQRSEERRGGKECGSTCRSRGSPYN